MSYYSPFDVGLRELEPAHLIALKSTVEGWYVEYKREVPNAGAVAKSVSAMANTYGGWIFYGIDELSKDNAVAGTFPGVPVEDLDALLQRLRQAVASHLHPAPHFDVKSLLGPCAEIDLAPDRAIICVHVPYSRTTPHLHKTGVIYRRVGDGSEPRPETDRFALDQLWGRSKEVEDFYERWVAGEPEFSTGEADAPYVRFLITADLNRDRDAWLDAGIKEVRQIMKGDGSGIELPFDMVHTISEGFVARQSSADVPSRMGLTWWLRRDLRSDILIPLARYDLSNLNAQQTLGYLHAKPFARLLRDRKLEDRGILDLNLLYFVAAGIMKTKQGIIDLSGWSGPLWCKIQVLNVWRNVPFIDSKVVVDSVERHGIPVCLQSRIDILPGTSPSTFFELPKLITDQPLARPFAAAALMLEFIATALGLPCAAVLDNEPNVSWFNELYNAGERARAAQDLRKRRTPSTF